MTRSTFNRHRMFAGFLLLVLVLAAANYYLDLGYFGRAARLLVVLATAAVFVYVSCFSPTLEDMREHKRKAP
jgi:hypothetical protein